jgi:hypothetical protein
VFNLRKNETIHDKTLREVGEEMLQKHCNIFSSTHTIKRALMTLSGLLDLITRKTKKHKITTLHIQNGVASGSANAIVGAHL